MQPTCEEDYIPRIKRGQRGSWSPSTREDKCHGKGKPGCPSCKFKMRGPNHQDGHHHMGGIPKNPRRGS